MKVLSAIPGDKLLNQGYNINYFFCIFLMFYEDSSYSQSPLLAYATFSKNLAIRNS